MLARERVSKKGCAHYGSTAEPRVDAEPQSKMSHRCGRRVRVQPRRAAAVRLDPLVKQIRTAAALRRRSAGSRRSCEVPTHRRRALVLGTKSSSRHAAALRIWLVDWGWVG